MKKIITILTFTLTLGIQQQIYTQKNQLGFAPKYPSDKMHQAVSFDITQLRSLNSSLVKTPEFRWLNYGLQLDQFYSSGMAEFWFMHNFPDSTAILGVTSGGEVVYPWIHKTATILDPKNMPDPWITTSTTYTLDSIGIVYAYLRSLPATVVDSLIIQIVKHDNSLVYTGIGGNYIWQDIEYNYGNNEIIPSQVINRIAVPLTVNDSSSFAKGLYLPVTGIPVQPGGNRIGAVVSFKPGYSYTITDSLSHKNIFYQLSMEQNGANTDPGFYGVPNDPNSDLNSSFILPTSVRYNFNPNGWNGYLIPAWAFVTGYRYEHHLIEFGITANISSIKTQDPSVALFNVLPIPAEDNLTLNIQMTQGSKAQVHISDLTGKVILQQNVGYLGSGFNSVQIPVYHLSSGNYTLSLITNSGLSTRKIVIAH